MGTTNCQLTMVHPGLPFRPAGIITWRLPIPVRAKCFMLILQELQATGTDLVRIPGTQNVFDMLIDIRDMLKNDRGLSNSQLSDLRNSLSDSLDEVSSLLLSKESSLGSKSSFLNNLKTSLDNLNTTSSDEVDSIKQADIAQVSIDLSRYENLYQMSLAVAGKLLSTSLLDYLD